MEKPSETVKTISTIIAVLLIPIVMFVWNYYENQKEKPSKIGQTSSESTVSTEENNIETVKPEQENKTVSEIIEENTDLVVSEVKEIPFTGSSEEDE